MINPAEYEAAVGAVQFMCGVASNGRQYTFAELTVDERTNREIEFTFCVPNDSHPKDELGLLKVLGGAPVNDAMGAWGLNATDVFRAQNHTVGVTVRDVPYARSVKVSGCSQMICVTIPKGPCFVNCCWSHDTVQKKLFVPTLNENMGSWRMSAILMQGHVKAHGMKPKTPLSQCFRFDLAYSEAGVCFFASDATLVRRIGPSLPYVNLWIPLEIQEDSSREYTSMCGARLIDNTRSRLLIFYDVLFVALPVVSGAFVRDVVNFPNCYVPLYITERETRDTPIIFEDSTDYDSVLVRIGGTVKFRIKMLNKHIYSDVHWVDLVKEEADETMA